MIHPNEYLSLKNGSVLVGTIDDKGNLIHTIEYHISRSISISAQCLLIQSYFRGKYHRNKTFFIKIAFNDVIWRHRSESTLPQIAVRQQAITWPNVDLSPVSSSGIHLQANEDIGLRCSGESQTNYLTQMITSPPFQNIVWMLVYLCMGGTRPYYSC